MSGSQKSREEILRGTAASPPGGDFEWDGRDEDERPLSNEEMRVAIGKRRLGRPPGSGQKEQVAIRFDRDVLAAFRAAGPGWQTRMNQALREWLAKTK
jgi:uncharacterized protein (DUF4415 family)